MKREFTQSRISFQKIIHGVFMIIGLFVFTLTACTPQQQDTGNPVVEPKESSQVVASTPAYRDSIQNEIFNSRQNALTRAIEKISPAVVGINVTEIREFRNPFYDPFFDMFFGQRRTYRQEVKGLGSGFIISPDGYILTNFHVAGNASKIIVTMTDGKKYDAEIIGADDVSDIALIKITGEDFPFIDMGNSEDVIIGEWAIALGNPFGLFEINEKPSVTVGVVSNTRMNFITGENRVYRNMIQTDAAINTGNSGGPLCNSLGQVIGVNSFIYVANQMSTGSIGIGFAIPINRAKEIMEDLKKYGKVDRTFWSGLKTQTLDPVVAKYFNLKNQEGVVVVEVEPDSPADKGGIKPADIITRINEVTIRSNRDMLIFVKDSKPGDRLDISLIRDGKPMNRSFSLGKK